VGDLGGGDHLKRGGGVADRAGGAWCAAVNPRSEPRIRRRRRGTALRRREKNEGLEGGGERRLLRVYVRRRAALGLGCHPGRVSAPPWAGHGLSRAWARVDPGQDSLVLFFLFFFSISGFFC